MKSEKGAEKHRSLLRLRKPLSDSTNLTTATTTKPTLKPNLSNPTTNSDVVNDLDNVNPSSDSTPSRPPVNVSSAHGTAEGEISEPFSVYARRKAADKRKSKEKAIVVPSSCPPAVKTQNIRNNIRKDREKGQSKACTAPPKKKQHHVEVSYHDLPQDFIKQQREYFAEIDAFQLEEEEVESGDKLE